MLEYIIIAIGTVLGLWMVWLYARRPSIAACRRTDMTGWSRQQVESFLKEHGRVVGRHNGARTHLFPYFDWADYVKNYSSVSVRYVNHRVHSVAFYGD